MQNDRITPEAMEKLAAPFPADCISHLPKGGVSLSYVGHANITARLNSVDPLWTWEPFAVDERGLPAMDYNAAGQPVGLWIRLTILGKTIPAYGSCTDKKMEPVKELIGDALRNGAMRFGVALYLWAKDGLEGDEVSQPAPAPQRPPQPAQRQNGHAGAPVGQTRTSAPQPAQQRPNTPTLEGDPVSPINQLCKYAGSIGVDNPTPNEVMHILKQQGAEFKAVTAGNLAAAKIHLDNHIRGPLPLDDEADPFGGDA